VHRREQLDMMLLLGGQHVEQSFGRVVGGAVSVVAVERDLCLFIGNRQFQ